jgi:hypothetical protein
MKKFLKKKVYFFALLISFSTLFSAILYAEGEQCTTDTDCPEGCFCIDGYCVQAGGVDIFTCYSNFTFSGNNVYLCCAEGSTKAKRCPSVVTNGEPLSAAYQCYK